MVRHPHSAPTARPVATLCSRRWAMGLVILAALAGHGVSRADEGSAALQQTAANGQWADVGSTAVGLAMGAAEANPLGLLTLGAKAIAYQQIQSAPATEQPRMWSAYGAMGWGAAANNLCVIAAIATGGGAAALCPLLGVAAGVGSWNNDRAGREQATFEAVCKQAQMQNPDLACRYTPPNV